MRPVSDNMLGAAYMSAAMAGLILNDTVMKHAAAHLSVYQGMFLRGLFATGFLALLAHSQGALKWLNKGSDRTIILWRGLLELAATILFLTALFNMPIANISAIMQSLPLVVTLAAALFLGERFGIRRGLAIIVGFIGVMLIIRPGSADFNIYSLLGLACVAVVAIRDILTRRLSVGINTLLVACVTAAMISLGGLVGVFVTNSWQAVDLSTVLWLILSALFLLCGYYFSVAAMRVGDVATVSPFRYTMMIWAILLGWLVFGDVPDGWTLLGIAIVVGAGFFTWLRERSVPLTRRP